MNHLALLTLTLSCSSEPLSSPVPPAACTALDPSVYELTWVRLDGTCDTPKSLMPDECEMYFDRGACDLLGTLECRDGFGAEWLIWPEPYGIGGEEWVFGGPLGHQCDSGFVIVGVRRK